jgi:hypothetical protein
MPVKKKPRPPYRKPDSVRELERMADAEVQKRYENVEAKYLCPRRYRDDNANALTKCVIDFLNLSGHMAERINCTGRYMDRSQTFEDVTGKVRTIGTGQWIPTSGMKGTADISATINGRSVKIEIKMKDKQSEVQREYQRRIEAAGGVYLIVRSFAEFMTWYNTFTVPNE